MNNRRMTDSISTTLRREIDANEIGPRLPPVRALVERFGATQFAVQKALETLKQEGYIETQVGRGTFVAGKDPSSTGELDRRERTPRVLLVSHVMRSGRGDQIASAVYDDFAQRGYSTVSISYNNTGDIETVLGRNSFDICLLQPRRSIIPASLLAVLEKSAKHVIVEGRNLERMNIDVILRDRYASFRQAIEHLRDLGHTRIGLISERVPGGAGYEDMERIFDVFATASGAVESSIVGVEGHEAANEESQIETLAKALGEEIAERGQAPSAFIVSGTFTGATITAALESRGLRIPDDVSVVRLRSVDDLPAPGGFFTSVARPPEQVAETIRRHIEWRLANPSAPPKTRFDPPTLTARGSTARIN